MGVTFKDLFCGAGGSITGMVNAGLELVIGANHDPRSIETVSTNHPDAEFLCCDINNLDMRRLPRTQVLWASVICTEGSPAGGGRKTRGQLAFEELGHVRATTWERTRACALDVLRATEIHRYDAVVVENVVEFARDWELYDWWVEGMRRLRPGYEVQVVNASAAHIHGDGNPPAPQWRDRLYIVFTRRGVPKPDLELRPPAWCDRCDRLVDAVQAWKRPDRRQIGKYAQQYLYRCPRDSSVVEPLVLPALAAVDLSDPGTRIGDRAKPLSARTRARIQWGIDTFCQPIVAQVAGNTYERPGYHRARPVFWSPLTTRNTTGEDALISPGPLVVNANHDDGRVFPAAAAPLPTRTTKIGDLLVTPWITMLRANNRPTGIDEPLATMATGRHHYLTVPPGFITKGYAGNAQPQHLSKPLTDPLGTITTRDHHYLVVPYRKGSRARPAGAGPLATITTIEAEALLQGWTLADYLACVDRYAAADVDLGAEPLVGLGSVCRRQSSTQIADIAAALAGLGIRLHGFGVKTLGLGRYARHLASADSLAWSYDARRRPALPGHPHRNCANCPTWALAWHQRALRRAAVQQLDLWETEGVGR